MFFTKKISSHPGGRFIISWLLGSLGIVLVGAFTVYPDPVWGGMMILACGIMLVCAHLIRRGYLSYVCISDRGISNTHTEIDWNHAHFTLYISDPNMPYGRGSVDVLYIDDHYLSPNEVKRKQVKMFVVTNPRRSVALLCHYRKKVHFINEPNSKRHALFLEHNSIS